MGTPYFILASGQSNIQGQSLLNWSPNPRAKIWNNDQENDASVGTAYNALQNTVCGIAPRYAHKIAEGDPNKDVYLARCAKQGRDILSWVGGGFFAFTGGYGDGTIVFNTTPNAATIIALSPKDVFGINRPYFTVNALPGETIWLKQGSAVYQYTLTSNIDYGANLITLYVSLVSAIGTITTGNIQVEFQPRLLTGIDNVVPAALAAAGKSTVDVFLWWQGESDAQYNTRYENEFGFLLSTLSSRSWWSPNTKIIICSPNSTANNNFAWADPFNSRLANIAAGGSNRYFANIPANVSPSAWQDVYHMTGQGYADAGDYVFNSVYAPPIGGGGGGGTGTISGMSVGNLTTVMDVSGNGNHQLLSGGVAYGLWLDGSPYPYKDGSGNKYIVFPHSENYRFLVGNWSDGSTWTLQGTTLTGARNTIEGQYNNRNWIFGVWSTGSNVYALMHHEWYVGTTTVDGIPGFNNSAAGANKRWVNAISWASSSNGGASFTSSPATNATRLVLIPEPWNVQGRDHMYGFFHPSNIVQEGAYYYAAVEQRSLNSTGNASICGVSLIRTTNVATPSGWEFWNGTGWTPVNQNSYQGNLGQVPYRFFEQENDFYTNGNYNSHMGQNLRYHTPTGQWLMFGYHGTGSTRFGYSASTTLASPQFTTIQPITNTNAGDYVGAAAKYVAVFDEAATDNNYMSIGNVVTVFVTNGNDGTPAVYSQIKRGTMTITVSGGTATYSISPSTTVVNEGSSVTFTITTTNVGSGTLYWTTTGTASASDFSDGISSGSVVISGDTGTITRTLLNDGLNEGNETFAIELRTGSTSGTIVATSSTVTVVDATTTTYSVTPSTTNVNEGASVTFTVTTTNFGNGTLYWTNSGSTNSSDFVDNTNSGSITITNNSGAVTRTLVNDALTEGLETIQLQIRTVSTSGLVVATSSTVTVNDTSVTPSTGAKFKIYQGNNQWIDASLASNFRFRNSNNSWINRTGNVSNLFVMNATKTAWIPFTGTIIPPTYSVAPSTSSVNEGSSVTFTVTTTNFGNGTLYWTNNGTSSGADFSDGLNSGSVSVTNNSGTITRTLVNDVTTEGPETLILDLRTGSTSGPVVATASTVTINDTSVPLPPTYSLSASTTTVTEGQTVVFTLTTTNVPNNTIIHWTNAGTTNINDFAEAGAFFTVVNNTATLSIRLSDDSITEGNETIIIQARTGSINGPIVATSPTVTVVDPAPTMLTMNRNDLDFVYLPDQTSSNDSAALDYRVTVTTTNFFNLATDPNDHIAIALDCGGEGGNNDPHCGPIVRNGRNIWVTARGFFITRSSGVFSEIWNGTYSPIVNPISNTSGQAFNFLNGTFTIRIRAGYRSGFFANRMTIRITNGTSIFDPVVFEGQAPIGADWVGFHRVALAAISIGAGGFVAPSPASGCIEKSGPGVAFGGYIPFSNFTLTVV